MSACRTSDVTPRRVSRYIAARLIRGPSNPRSGGPTCSLGANPAVDPREAQALLAPARQLTPPADERERFAATTTLDPCACAVRARRRLIGLRRGVNRP